MIQKKKSMKNKVVAFNLYGKLRIGKIIDERINNDQDPDWKEYRINYKWYREPVWVSWHSIWDGKRKL